VTHHANLAVTTTMFNEIGDIIPFAPARKNDRLLRFNVVMTEIDTNASPALVFSLVLTTAPSVAFSSKTDYTVIASIPHSGAASYVYNLDDATAAIQEAAKFKYVPGDATLSWALKVATAPATAAAGTIVITLEVGQWMEQQDAVAFA
jgi:hypothetical protein